MNTFCTLFIGPLYRKKPLKNESLPSDIPCFLIDGGNRFFKKAHPLTLRLGDGDSYRGKLDILLPKEKNLSDLAYGLGLLSKKIKMIFLRGFLGGRRDHELFNLGEMHGFLKKRTGTIAFFDKEIIFLSKGSYEIELHCLFSLACLEKTKLSLSGECEYKLKNYSLSPLSSRGLSNIGKGKILLKTQGPLFILIRGKNS